MTTKSTGSKELEAIETIILLLSKVKSNEGIMQVTQAIEERSKGVIKNELRKARDKVRELERSLSVFDKAEVSGEEKKEEKPVETKPKKTPDDKEEFQENRPVFTVSNIEKIISKKFIDGKAPGYEFTLESARDYVGKEMGLSDSDKSYTTSSGNNLFQSSIRNTFRSMTNRFKLHRIKPGLYAVPLRGVNEKQEVKEFVTWE
jgi:hypothetical protein